MPEDTTTTTIQIPDASTSPDSDWAGDPGALQGRLSEPRMKREPGWEARPEVRALAEQLRGLRDTGAVLRIDSSSFEIIVWELPEVNPAAEPGDPGYWDVLGERAEKLEVPRIKGVGTPHDLIAALGLLLGFGSESV